MSTSTVTHTDTRTKGKSGIGGFFGRRTATSEDRQSPRDQSDTLRKAVGPTHAQSVDALLGSDPPPKAKKVSRNIRTLDDVAQAICKAEERATSSGLCAGERISKYLAQEQGKGRKRADVIAEIAEQAQSHGRPVDQSRINRYLKIYQVAIHFDADAALTLPDGVLVAFAPFVRRGVTVRKLTDGTECRIDTWARVDEKAAFGDQLWRRAIEEKLTAKQVRAEIAAKYPKPTVQTQNGPPAITPTARFDVGRLQEATDEEALEIISTVLEGRNPSIYDAVLTLLSNQDHTSALPICATGV